MIQLVNKDKAIADLVIFQELKVFIRAYFTID